MGPGLTLAVLGSAAAVPTALIFTFDSAFFFAAVPMLMALSGKEHDSKVKTSVLNVAKNVFTHPFIVATMLGVVFAGRSRSARPPRSTRSSIISRTRQRPCALFTLGVTVALRPLNSVPEEIPILVAIKLLLHPLIVWLLLSAIGGFEPVWVYTAVDGGPAARPSMPMSWRANMMFTSRSRRPAS
jgi:malonate transporter and related proteins